MRRYVWDSLFLAGLILLAGAGMMTGCRTDYTPTPAPWTAAPDSNGIPNLKQVEPGVFRGGQPDRAGFAWLKEQGLTNVIKLNSNMEGSDLPGEDLGLTVRRYPIGTMEQLVQGPDPGLVSKAVKAIRPGTFIHCEHGQDRTGLIVGLYRLQEGWPKADAWLEMKTNGFHSALFGLSNYWALQPDLAAKKTPLNIAQGHGTNFLGVYLGMIAIRDVIDRKWDFEKQCFCGEPMPPGVQMFSATSGQLLRWISADEFTNVYILKTQAEYPR